MTAHPCVDLAVVLAFSWYLRRFCAVHNCKIDTRAGGRGPVALRWLS